MKTIKLDCQTHITGLHYDDKKLIIGCGQEIEIFCLISNHSLIKKQVFDCFNVNGLRTFDKESSKFIIVFGNRFFSIYKFIENCPFDPVSRSSDSAKTNRSISKFDLELILERINLYDWILDVQFSSDKIYCLLTSNRLGCFDLTNNQLIKINCEQNCTIFTSKFLNDFHLLCDLNHFNQNDFNLNQLESSANDSNELTTELSKLSIQSIVVAAGTVFSEILICEYTQKDCKIIDRLIGHQGVIFSIDFKNDLLASASDDRTVRLWKFDLNKRCFSSIFVLYGHESR